MWPWVGAVCKSGPLCRREKSGLAVFRRPAVQAVFPTLAGFVNGLLDEVAEDPEHAGRAKAGKHAHEDFVSECALHLETALSTSLAACGADFQSSPRAAQKMVPAKSLRCPSLPTEDFMVPYSINARKLDPANTARSALSFRAESAEAPAPSK